MRRVLLASILAMGAFSCSRGAFADDAQRALGPPPALPVAIDEGRIESALKRDLTDAVLAIARSAAGPWDNQAIADFAQAVLAVVAHDAETLARARGLGAATARAGLTYALDARLQPDPACVGAARIDAIYDGLSSSVWLGQLGFPAPPATPGADCAATGKRATAYVDGVLAAQTSVDATSPAGRVLASAAAHGTLTVDDLRTLIRSLATGAGVPARGVAADLVDAMADAVVPGEGGVPTVSPDAMLEQLAKKYSPLGPWVFELNGGIPNVDFSQQKVVADATFGYSTRKIGAVGRGWADTYDLPGTKTHDDYTHAGGSLEGWWLGGAGEDRLRLELRLAGAFDYYDTTTFPLQNALSDFYDFDSRMVRGSFLLGLRYGAPADRVSGQLLAGGGMQYEDPDTTAFTGGKQLTLQSDSNLTAQGSGRLLVRVHLVPGILGVRLRGDATYFSITREDLTVTSSGAGGLAATASVQRAQQIEAHGRLFLDADIAAFFDFVPAAFVGVDYLGISGSTTSATNAIPVLGVGVLRRSL